MLGRRAGSRVGAEPWEEVARAGFARFREAAGAGERRAGGARICTGLRRCGQAGGGARVPADQARGGAGAGGGGGGGGGGEEPGGHGNQEAGGGGQVWPRVCPDAARIRVRGGWAHSSDPGQ